MPEVLYTTVEDKYATIDIQTKGTPTDRKSDRQLEDRQTTIRQTDKRQKQTSGHDRHWPTKQCTTIV